MGNVLLDRAAGYSGITAINGDGFGRYDEKRFPDQEGGSGLSQSIQGEDYTYRQYFYSPGSSPRSNSDPPIEDPAGAIIFAGYAFVAAVFLPTVALLGAIASVTYIARLMGEEIDLSRITQLV
ncbi:hypothetical protein HZC07_02705 [Candidatus Micrarchaeota archaeon]|nr:hypothetical protein [Candidatus Micrarchaeota archaeon]